MCVCVQTLRQHLQQENMKKAILGNIDFQTAVGLVSGSLVPPTTPEIIQEAFKNVRMCHTVQAHVLLVNCTDGTLVSSQLCKSTCGLVQGAVTTCCALEVQ